MFNERLIEALPREYGGRRSFVFTGVRDTSETSLIMLQMPTNFLWASGTAGGVGNVGGTATGQIAPFISLLTSELSTTGSAGLASASGVVSSANSSVGLGAGIFSNTTGGSGTYQGIWGDVWFKAGGSATGTALTAGANLAGWFLSSYDGVNFESTTNTAGPARSPDFFIPLPVITGSGLSANAWYKASGVASIKFPPYNFKCYIQNNSGVALTAGTGPLIVAAISAFQY